MAGVLAVAQRIPGDPCPLERGCDDDRALLRDGQGSGVDLVRFALIADHTEAMRDLLRDFRSPDVDEKEHDGAAAAFEGQQIGRGLRAAAIVEALHHGGKRRSVEGRAAIARAGLDRDNSIGAADEVRQHHLVGELCRPVLHDRGGLRQERHRELRRMRVGGDRGRRKRDERGDKREPEQV